MEDPEGITLRGISQTEKDKHCISSVAQWCLTLCDPVDCSTPRFPVHHQLLELAHTHVHRVSDASHPTISSSVVPFSSRLQSFSASGSFPMSQFFASGSRTIGVSALASVLPMNSQDWLPLGLTGWISLQSKGLWRVSHGIAYKWNLKKKPHRESTRGPGVGENGEMLVREYRLLVIKGISSGSLMYSMMIIINNTILYTWKLLEDSRSKIFLPQKRNGIYVMGCSFSNRSSHFTTYKCTKSTHCTPQIYTTLYVGGISIKLE